MVTSASASRGCAIPELGVSVSEASIEKFLARTEILRLRVERLEAEVAAAGPPLTAEEIYARGVYAALKEDAPVATLPKTLTRTCGVCLERQPIENFHNGRTSGKRQYRRICGPCFAEGYSTQQRANAALRARLAEIEKWSLTCVRCKQKKPALLFREGERTCLHCKIAVLEAQNAGLLERVPRGGDWRREKASRDRHSNPAKYATRDARRLDLILKQADGSLTAEVVGRLFVDAEGKPCPYCGEYMNRRTKSLDHMIPIAKGGLHSAVNAIICCVRCNSRKRDLGFGEWLAKLKEPFISLACAEYERRYGVQPAQCVLPLQFTLGAALVVN